MTGKTAGITKNEANAKRGLYISLAKNAAVFHKLPGGSNEAAVFGLTEWYSDVKVAADDKPAKRKKKRTAKAAPETKPDARKLLPKGGQNDEEG